MDTFTPRHILGATDGSPRSLAAVAAAADLARQTDARLTLVVSSAPRPERRADPRSQSHADAALTMAAKEAREHLGKADAVARAHGVLPALEHVYAEEPYTGILVTARLRGCDLIVAASRGRGRAAGLILGSQTQSLLVHSHIPVLVCPDGRAPSWDHILVPIDGTEGSESAMPVGVSFARLQGARITVLMCSPRIDASDGVDGSEYEKLAKAAATPRIASAAAGAWRQGIPTHCRHAFAAAPWREIVDTAEDVGAGVICMASHRRSGRLAAALASETLMVITHSRVPVLVCRAPEAADRFERAA